MTDLELLDQRREGICAAGRGPSHALAHRLPEQESWCSSNAGHPGHVELRIHVVEHEGRRLTVPEKPPSEVAARQSLGWHQMTYDDTGIVVAPEVTAAAEPHEDLVVFAADQRVVDLAQVRAPSADR